MLYVVKEDLAGIEKVNPESFSNLDIWERQHIQEWVRQCPEILGEDLLVVSMEFDKFKASNDRLDLLALDQEANLVVVELKRTAHGQYADLQAIRYAAMVSSMTLDTLLPYYMEYLRRHDPEEEVTEESARAKIASFAEDFDDLSLNPRIILGSEDFSPEITTTVLWLNNNGLDISCVRIRPFKMGAKTVLAPQKIIPLAEASQYTIEIRKKEARILKGERARNRPRAMTTILANNLLKSGDRIYLKNSLPDYLVYEPDDPEFHATITGKRGQNVRWDKDGKEYSLTALTMDIFKSKSLGGVAPSLVGAVHWVTEDGTSLWDLAEQYWPSNEEGGARSTP